MKHSILGSLLSLAIKHTRAAFALSIMLLMMGFASSSRVILIPSTFHRAPTTIKNRSRKNKIECYMMAARQPSDVNFGNNFYFVFDEEQVRVLERSVRLARFVFT